MKQLIIAVFCMLLSAAAFAGANIQFEKLNLDAGTLRPRSRAKIVFKFKNSGDALLKIAKIDASCGCTVPKLSKRELAPGESGELVLWFYTAGYYGAVTKTAKVITNSELNPSLVVSFNAVIKSELLPDETEINFQDVVPGQVVEKEITIKNEMEQPAKLDAGKVLSGTELVEKTGFMWKVRNLADGDVKIEFGAKLKRDAGLVRPARFKIRFQTNSKLDPELVFSVTIRPMPPMVVTPSSLFLSDLLVGAKHVAAIHIDSNGGEELAITRVRLSNVPFSYEVKTVSKTSVVVWLNVNDSAPSGRLQGALQIFTTVGGVPKMRIIPVKGSVQ
jgi:hypothetical protein